MSSYCFQSLLLLPTSPTFHAHFLQARQTPITSEHKVHLFLYQSKRIFIHQTPPCQFKSISVSIILSSPCLHLFLLTTPSQPPNPHSAIAPTTPQRPHNSHSASSISPREAGTQEAHGGLEGAWVSPLRKNFAHSWIGS